MEKNYTLYFDEINKNDLHLVGGKGANLGEMTQAGFPVPYGFCVTTKSYMEFIRHNDLEPFISQIIKDADFDNIAKVGQQIREKIQQSAIPKMVEHQIIEAVKKLGIENYYAVRSSATAEDLAFASFAGQQDTYLNIKGESALLDSVRNCWASLFTDRAILYRIRNKIGHEKVHMSVVIQKMILPEVSGIMFTADPISGHREIVSIDAGYGLGEALVSGLVSPDIYKYDRRSKNIESKIIAEKKLAIMPLEGGGTVKAEIGSDKASSQVLKDSQIKALAELGISIEKHYGCPQDIEWCIQDDALYIVQSRAITSLFPMPKPLPKDDSLHAYVSFNHFQVMTAPISPLGIDMLRLILPFDKGVRRSEDYTVTKTAAGRIYLDISEVLQYKKPRHIISSFMSNADALAAAALAQLISRPDFEERIVKNKNAGKALRKFFMPIALACVKNLAFRKPEGTVEFMNSYVNRQIKEVSDAIESSMPGIERLDAIYDAAGRALDFRQILPIMASAMVSFKALEAMEQKLLGTRKHSDIIVKGLEGNITTEMGLLVGDPADMARNSPQLIREFTDNDYATLHDRINDLKNDEFRKKYNDFIGIYDMRAAGEIDMARERWIENPEPLARAIISIADTSQEGIHRKEYKQTIERAKKASIELVREVEAKHGKSKAKLVKRMVRVLRNYMPVREHPKYLIMKCILIFKKAFLDEARLLVAKGHLLEEKDIFYVNFWELYNAVQNNESLIELVSLRKEEYEHFEKLTPPRLITSDGEEIKACYKRDDLPEGALPGMPVSSGVIEGIARVITDPSQASINKGEILVAPFTDPGWTPLFINAAGLVMEVGGLLTHGTVVAREYGIPAVVGITEATTKIRTGQKIRVDGDAGFVMIIEE